MSRLLPVCCPDAAAGLAAGSEEGAGQARYWSPAAFNPDTDGGDEAYDGGGAETP